MFAFGVEGLGSDFKAGFGVMTQGFRSLNLGVSGIASLMFRVMAIVPNLLTIPFLILHPKHPKP